jgi:large subunit ribosomal protein L9
MKIILTKEVRALGKAGETKEVSDGYARNFLLAKGLAREATTQAVKELSDRKDRKQKQSIKINKLKRGLAKKINNRDFLIVAKADESGTLYAGLNAAAISEELKMNKFFVEPDEIKLAENIKKIGEYEIELVLAGEKAKIKLLVTNLMK